MSLPAAPPNSQEQHTHLVGQGVNLGEAPIFSKIFHIRGGQTSMLNTSASRLPDEPPWNPPTVKKRTAIYENPGKTLGFFLLGGSIGGGR